MGMIRHSVRSREADFNFGCRPSAPSIERKVCPTEHEGRDTRDACRMRVVAGTVAIRTMEKTDSPLRTSLLESTPSGPTGPMRTARRQPHDLNGIRLNISTLQT